MSDESRSLSIIVVPDDGRESHTFTVSYRRLRRAGIAALVVAVLLGLMAGSWWYLAARAARVPALEAELATTRTDQARLGALVAQLQELEQRYERIRGLFGSDTTSVPSDLWLPPPSSGRGRSGSDDDVESSLPTSWPLTEPGFVTQALLEGAAGEHPGVDIAIPTHSYVRAAGAGTVVDAGHDDIYGFYLVIDHGNGYRSRYAHAAELLAEEGRRVRRNEVIALTGSTGRSTAPHLHFEIMLDGAAVDPMTLLEPPG